jgi:Polysaccharide deacetylase
LLFLWLYRFSTGAPYLHDALISYRFIPFPFPFFAPHTAGSATIAYPILMYFHLGSVFMAGFFATHALLPLVYGARSFYHAAGFVVDTFQDSNFNDLGAWHGPGEGMPTTYGNDSVTFSPTDADQNYHTQLSAGCFDLEDYAEMYLHVSFSGTKKFSISLNQHNEDCDWEKSPYPETWDTIEAARYTSGNHIYVPLSHFAIDLSQVISVSFHGFYTRKKVTLHKVEIVPYVPHDFHVPRKLPSGKLVLKCKRPNSFAFGIDDGEPELAPKVMQILQEEGVLVTFFVVGGGLDNPGTNFTNVYREMLSQGHQVALHSYTHPR